MTHYDEFNVSPSATPEEIRLAHRNLARLLHPDSFQDANLRALAECQMKRINRIYGVLSDPAQRLAYDRQLGAMAMRGREPRREDHSWKRMGPWLVAAAGLSFGIMPHLQDPAVAVSGQSAPVSAAKQPEGPEGAAGETAAAPRAARDPQASRGANRTPRPKRVATPEPDGRVDRPTQTASRIRMPERMPEPNVAPATTPPVPAMTIAEPEAPRPAPAGSRDREPVRGDVTGTWLYVPATRKESEDLYPPEYIELSISSDREALWGRYRARYRVADRAISPEVDFRFEAKLPAPERIAWSGNAGAKGEVRFKLLSANRLSVEWFTKSFGQQLALGSGTAVLIRRD